MCVLAGFTDSHSYSLSYKLIPRVTLMKLLHIDSSVLGPPSVSRQVSAAIADRLRKATPGLGIVYRDLTSTPLAHLSGQHLTAAQGAAPDAALRQDLAAGSTASWWPARLSNTARKARKDWPATSASSSRSRAVDSTAPARRPRSANIWKPICAGCSVLSVSKTPNLFPPTAFRSDRSIA